MPRTIMRLLCTCIIAVPMTSCSDDDTTPARLDAATSPDSASADAPSTPDSATADSMPDSRVMDGGDAAAGDAMADAGESDTSVADGAVISSLCASGEWEIGHYATWCGKLNVRRPAGGDWTHDADCKSGCDQKTVGYCQKFWPAASNQVMLSEPEAGDKPFKTGGCGSDAPAPGTAQYACCAPNPCGDGFRPVGDYVTWCGKVNIHRDLFGDWTHDSDCSSGCGVNTVSYCQKFWPAASKQVKLSEPEAGDKPFKTGGCDSDTPAPGTDQYVCCAPM